MVGANNNTEQENNEDMVKVTSGEHCFYLDGYLKANLDHLKHEVKRNDYDGFIIIAGKERYGKSTLASQVAKYLDPTYNLDRCTFTAEQFKHAVGSADKFQAVVFDETMGYLSSRQALSKFNRSLIKIFSEMGSKNLFIILCIPNFFELDRYPAMHRSTGLLYVYKRSFFGAYDYPTKKELYVRGKKIYSYVVKPNFTGRFVKYFTLNKTDYEAKKQQAINEWETTSNRDKIVMEQRDSLISECFVRKLLTIKELSTITKLSDMQIRRILT